MPDWLEFHSPYPHSNTKVQSEFFYMQYSRGKLILRSLAFRRNDVFRFLGEITFRAVTRQRLEYGNF